MTELIKSISTSMELHALFITNTISSISLKLVNKLAETGGGLQPSSPANFYFWWIEINSVKVKNSTELQN